MTTRKYLSEAFFSFTTTLHLSLCALLLAACFVPKAHAKRCLTCDNYPSNLCLLPGSPPVSLGTGNISTTLLIPSTEDTVRWYSWTASTTSNTCTIDFGGLTDHFEISIGTTCSGSQLCIGNSDAFHFLNFSALAITNNQQYIITLAPRPAGATEKCASIQIVQVN